MATLLTIMLSMVLHKAHAYWPEDRVRCPIPARLALRAATRLIVVKVESGRSFVAEMELWERVYSKGAKKDFRQNWRQVKKQIPVSVGRNGLGWGYEYRNQDGDPRTYKQEGDGRTPEGLFALGDRFGFSTEMSPGYLSLTSQTRCVDDVNSKYYNQMVEVENDRVKHIWARTKQPLYEQGTEKFVSSEVMSLNQDYAFGININYVSDAAEKAGSCIFLHTRQIPTEGCVSMNTRAMMELSEWIGGQRGAILITAKNHLDRWSACWP